MTPTYTDLPTPGPTATVTPTFERAATLPGRLFSYPNPGTVGKRITLIFPACSQATLEIFDWSGHRVAQLSGAAMHGGDGYALWDGRNEGGEALASGLYFAHVHGCDGDLVCKLTLVRD